MSKYYDGNAFYDFIGLTNSLKFPHKNLWFLVYGNKNSDPKVILLLAQYTEKTFKNENLSENEIEMLEYIRFLSNCSKVPYIYVRFNADENALTHVKVMINGKLIDIKVENYTKLLVDFGLKRSSGFMKKGFNSKASNLYHLWQSNCGLEITTTDVDLIYLGPNKTIKTIFELKRSYIPIDSWEPFKDDYNNFKLLAKLLNPCGISLYILFNQYTKTTLEDDISFLKIYKIIYDRELTFDYLGIQDILKFIKNLNKY